MSRDSDSGSGKKGEGPGPSPKPGPRPESAAATRPARTLRVIEGEGRGRDETLRTRDDVARLLVSSAADMLLKRISPDRAHEIERRVDRIMRLFDRSKDDPVVMPLLKRELDDLEQLWREGQKKKRR